MVNDIQDLRRLLEAPNERLDVELKTWLDLKAKGHRGTLAKALIALANHGGGKVIIGFDDSNGNPAQGRPQKLSSYSQDTVNDILDRFADPCFHCTVQMVTRDDDGLEYPIISVPGGHKVPIRSKRGSPGNEIQADRYYIRRSGPASETPKGGHEWGELILRCVRNNTDEIVSLVRDVLEGRVPKADAAADTADRIARWEKNSISRWSELINKFTPESHVRMPHGHYRVAAVIEGIDLDILRLREVMRRAEQSLTGWPPWMWPAREGNKPRPHENTIECHITEGQYHADAADSDFWRASTTGQLFIVRGYPEDSPKRVRQPPGTVFDLTYPIWKIGECLLFIQRFATEAGAAESTVSVCCQWSGLEGRMLAALFNPRRDLFRDYRSSTNKRASKTIVPVAKISGALPEIVRDLVSPLYELFDFFHPPDDIYAKELARMQGREL